MDGSFEGEKLYKVQHLEQKQKPRTSGKFIVFLFVCFKYGGFFVVFFFSKGLGEHQLRFFLKLSPCKIH